MRIFTLIAFFSLFAFSSHAQLVDADLETGAGGIWNEASSNFGTPLCDVNCGNCGGPCAPQSGAWYAWFGGAGGLNEVGAIDQFLTIPDGSSATLSFYAMIAEGGSESADDVMTVQMDGVDLWSITGADAADYSSYTEVSVSVSFFADGNEHWLNIKGENVSGANVNMLIDNFTLTVDGADATTVNELINKETEVVVFPNPAVNEVNVQFNQDMRGEATVKIYGTNGQVISQETLAEVHATVFTMDTSELENGLYFLEVQSGEQLVTKRFMVQK